MESVECNELPYDILQIIYSYLDIDTRIIFRKIYNKQYIFMENKIDFGVDIEKSYIEEISENKYILINTKYNITKQLCEKCNDFEYSTLRQKDDKHMWLGKICICNQKISNNNFNLNLNSDCKLS